MDQIIEKLLTAADNHGLDTGEPGHTVGDLQDLLRSAWKIMTASQKLALLGKDVVEDMLMARMVEGLKASDLADLVNASLAKMDAEVQAAGYDINVNPIDDTFFWETEEEQSMDYESREDAVENAFKHLSEAKALKFSE